MNTIERRIVSRVIAAVLKAGWVISIDDGSGEPNSYLLRRSTDKAAILAELGSMGEDVLHVSHPTASPASSFIHFVYGNDEDVVCDHGASLTPIINPILGFPS